MLEGFSYSATTAITNRPKLEDRAITLGLVDNFKGEIGCGRAQLQLV